MARPLISVRSVLNISEFIAAGRDRLEDFSFNSLKYVYVCCVSRAHIEFNILKNDTEILATYYKTDLLLECIKHTGLCFTKYWTIIDVSEQCNTPVSNEQHIIFATDRFVAAINYQSQCLKSPETHLENIFGPSKMT
jgi:hypothetical protein